MAHLQWLGRATSGLDPRQVAIANELDRLCENVTYSGQSQFSVSKLWRTSHLLLNTSATAVAAVAGVSSITETVGPVVAGIGALIAAGLAGINTALGASQRSAAAADSANSYIEIRDRIRQLGCLDLVSISDDEVRERLDALTGRIHEVNKNSGVPGQIAWRMSRKSIERGGQSSSVDLDAVT